MHRRVWLAGEGMCAIEQDLRTEGPGRGLDVSGPYWVFGLVRVLRGRVRYLHGTHAVEPPDGFFGMFLPPYSVVQVELKHTRCQTLGIASGHPLPRWAPERPVIFRCRRQRAPSSLEEVLAELRQGANFQVVSREAQPSAAAAAAKHWIDAHYASERRLAAMSRELGIAPAVLSRNFKRHYGMAPVEYRHAIRVMDAMVRLVEGQTVAEVALDVGFQDLSRFYRHFGGLTCATPARYRQPSKNAKKSGDGSATR